MWFGFLVALHRLFRFSFFPFLSMEARGFYFVVHGILVEVYFEFLS